MKAITLLACMIVTFTSCNCQKKAAEQTTVAPSQLTNTDTNVNQEKEMPVMEYEAVSRGYYLKVRVENRSLYISKERDASTLMNATPINDADWTEIEKLAKAVDIEKVKDLKWPTEMRFYDGAPHAHITFSLGRAKYPSAGFDHKHPPAAIEKLVNKIVALAEKNE